MTYTSSPQTDEEEMLPNSSEIVSLPAAPPSPQAEHVINYPLFIMPTAKSAAGAYLLFWALG